MANDEIKTETQIHNEDSSKTVTSVSGGEASRKNNTPDMRVSADTQVNQDDPLKTETTLTRPGGDEVTVTFEGPYFRGPVKVKNGSTLLQAFEEVEKNAEVEHSNFRFQGNKRFVGVKTIISSDITVVSYEK